MEVWRELNIVVAVWCSVFGLVRGYWAIAEAAAPGRQYADPTWPCVWLASLFSLPVLSAVWFVSDLRRRK